MILCVHSSLPGFKSLQFRRGLNVLIADRTGSSTEGQTRNSAGKSSVVEIVHFLLGADVARGSLFQLPEIVEHSFSATIRISGRLVRVTRSGKAADRILIDDRSARQLGIRRQRDERTREPYVALKDWRDFLGHTWFGLPLERKGTDFAASRSPTFRMLFGYFARRSRDIGFADFARYGRDMQEADARVALSYLLGLDWRIPRRIEEDRKRHGQLKVLRQVIKEGGLGDVVATSAALRPEIARAEARVAELTRRIEGFRVHDQYPELATEAADLRSEASEITLALAGVRSSIAFLEKAAIDEAPPPFASVESLYGAIGIELPDVARRSFEDVAQFQASVIANRRAFVEEQIADASGERYELEAQLTEANRRRDAILAELRGKGAFDEFTRLQGQQMEAIARRDSLQDKLKAALQLETSTAERKRQSAEDELLLQKDYETRGEEIGRAVGLVDRAIGQLYDDREGNLVISPTKNGPKFDLRIGGSGNQGGIDQMKVFCFDMMLFERVTERLGGPRFLIHDSHLFDGVDPRQTRSALLLGREVAARVHGQYIVLLNSDKFEKLGDEAVLQDAVLPVRLMDTEVGGLFGFRFDLPSQRR